MYVYKLPALLCTHLSTLLPASEHFTETEAERAGPAYAYGFNGYAHCFSRTFKKTKRVGDVKPNHAQAERSRQESEYLLSLSLTQAVDLLKANRTQHE
jgi:hypothetical protein